MKEALQELVKTVEVIKCVRGKIPTNLKKICQIVLKN